MSQYSLDVVDNYLVKLNSTSADTYLKYMTAVMEYVDQAETALSISKVDYFRYVVMKGLETLTHVFRMLVMYTRNSDLAFFNSKKALYYYIEFIGQIGDDNHEFLSLTSNDAAMFVYKKTIFAVNVGSRKEYKETDEEKSQIDNILLLTELTLFAFKSQLWMEDVTKNDDLSTVTEKVKGFAGKMIELSSNRSSMNYNSKLKQLQAFVDQMATAPFTGMDVYEAMCRKIDKNDMSEESIKNAVDKVIDKKESLTVRKFANAVTSEASA